MKNVLFTGACTALVTPFLNGEVNYPMMEQLLKRQMEVIDFLIMRPLGVKKFIIKKLVKLLLNGIFQTNYKRMEEQKGFGVL
jgi:hypothetical protein